MTMERQTSLHFPIQFVGGRPALVGGVSSRDATNQEIRDGIKSGAFFLLSTSPGELPMRGSVGVGAEQRIFAPAEEIASFLPDDISTQFKNFSQRIQLDAVNFSRDTDGVLVVDVAVSALLLDDDSQSTLSVRLL